MGLLSKIFGRGKDEQQQARPEMTPEAAERIVNDYSAALLGPSAPVAGCVADVRHLPHSKERIKQALLFALSATKEPQMRDALKSGFLMLADWQAGVGSGPVGLDLTGMDPNSDFVEMAKLISSQGTALEKWIPVVEAERRALASDLQKLGQWP